MLFALVSSNKHGVGDILERERLELSVSRVKYKAKPKGGGTTLEETRLDHAIRSSVAITKLPLCHPEEKDEQQKGEMRFFE